MANFAKSMVGMEEFVPPLASNDEAATTSREGAEQKDEDGVVIVSEEGVEIGYAYPSFHLGVKRHVLGTSILLGINRHLLGTRGKQSEVEFADALARNASFDSESGLSRQGSSEDVSPATNPRSVAFAVGSTSAAAEAPHALEVRDLSGVKLSMLRPSAHHLDIQPVEKPAPPSEKPPDMP